MSVMTSGGKKGGPSGSRAIRCDVSALHALPGTSGDREVLDVRQLDRFGERVNSRLGLRQAFHDLGVVGLVDLVDDDDQPRWGVELVAVGVIVRVIVGVTVGVIV